MFMHKTKTKFQSDKQFDTSRLMNRKQFRIKDQIYFFVFNNFFFKNFYNIVKMQLKVTIRKTVT